MSVQRLHDALILRKCRICGLEATNTMELELFKKDSRGKYDRANLCKECEGKVVRGVLVKTCSQCNRELPLNLFWRDNSKVNSKHRAYCKDCGKKYSSSKEYVDNHNAKPEVKTRKNEWIKRNIKALSVMAISALCDYEESKCKKCGYSTDERALCIDHINHDGKKERSSYERTKMFKRIIKDPEKAKLEYQVLCRNCNWIKHMEHMFGNGGEDI